MNINANFHLRAVAHTESLPWVPSPMAGVERRMLDRIGGEVARATTVVRYAPNSQFSAHLHGGGEEFLVLEGVFQDEHGDYPVGTYIRNPPQSSHKPGTVDGAIILVKLWQFDAADRTPVRVDTLTATPVRLSEGVQSIPLHSDDRETVRLEFWSPHTPIEIRAHDGLEVFVLQGQFQEGAESFTRHSWLRLPVGHDFLAMTGSEGARVWIKSGHLSIDPAISNV